VAVPAGAAPGSVAVAPPLALRVARAAARLGDARVLDRLVRGRVWIALVAVGLMGIVFVQVSMLRLNAGISRAVASADTLERQNSILRADISELDASQRISDTAGALGMIRPPAGQVNYLDARKADGAAAARAIRPPQPVKGAGTTTSAQQQAVATAQPTAITQSSASAPSATTAQAGTPAQTAQSETAPSQTASASQTTASQTTASQTTASQTTPSQTLPARTVPAQTAAGQAVGPSQTSASQTQAQPVQTQAQQQMQQPQAQAPPAAATATQGAP
jgi:hypothetical protein